jgi:ubiquinone/menaquinone biosynthesis C-methylase UbiE
LSVTENLKESIHKANVEVHSFEAKYYEFLHPEVYSRQEQNRIALVLKTVDRLIKDNHKKALDFGAGTGNLTSKLLRLGYAVTAIDVSTEMCAIIKKRHKSDIEAGKLTVINSPIENVSFSISEFDLITCYSVLHHLPDYVSTLQKLSLFLKKGGVIYLEHEASPFYWKDEPNKLANFIKLVYFHSIPSLNILYFRIRGVSLPSIDYTLSDYWHKKEHPLNHAKIESFFKKKRFGFFKKIDYYQTGTWIVNPLFYIYKITCKPEMSFWLARK